MSKKYFFLLNIHGWNKKVKLATLTNFHSLKKTSGESRSLEGRFKEGFRKLMVNVFPGFPSSLMLFHKKKRKSTLIDPNERN